jgi:hypothetical protein
MPNGLKDRVYYGLGAKPMPETTVNIFISAVSDEFASYRKALYKFMDGRGATVKIQERFVQNGHPTLSLLNSYIAKCDAVIHLVGDRTGKSDKHGIPGPKISNRCSINFRIFLAG